MDFLKVYCMKYYIQFVTPALYNVLRSYATFKFHSYLLSLTMLLDTWRCPCIYNDMYVMIFWPVEEVHCLLGGIWWCREGKCLFHCHTKHIATFSYFDCRHSHLKIISCVWTRYSAASLKFDKTIVLVSCGEHYADKALNGDGSIHRDTSYTQSQVKRMVS